MKEHPTTPCLLEDALADETGGLFVVPDGLRDRIHAALDEMFATVADDLEPEREHFYRQFLAYFNRYGTLPKGELVKNDSEGAT